MILNWSLKKACCRVEPYCLTYQNGDKKKAPFSWVFGGVIVTSESCMNYNINNPVLLRTAHCMRSLSLYIYIYIYISVFSRTRPAIVASTISALKLNVWPLLLVSQLLAVYVDKTSSTFYPSRRQRPKHGMLARSFIQWRGCVATCRVIRCSEHCLRIGITTGLLTSVSKYCLAVWTSNTFTIAYHTKRVLLSVYWCQLAPSSALKFTLYCRYTQFNCLYRCICFFMVVCIGPLKNGYIFNK